MGNKNGDKGSQECYHDSNNLEHNYISLLAFIKEEAERKSKLDSLVRKCFKLTKMHRESQNLFE